MLQFIFLFYRIEFNKYLDLECRNSFILTHTITWSTGDINACRINLTL
jgi:hypothetical protein